MNIIEAKETKNEFIQIMRSNGTPQKKIWMNNGYCRMNKRWELINVEDVNDFKYIPGDKDVVIAEY